MRNRNIILLSFGQAMALAGPPVVVLLGGILGMQLAPSPSLATLPISAMVIGVALFTIPASFFMRRFGRRVGFSLSSLMASLACLLAAYAVATNQFSAFCLAALLVGANGAFVQQYRFAATESVDPEYAGRAASFVLLGGIVGGFTGPGLAVLAKDWLPTQTYVGSFLVIAALYALASAALAFMIDVAVEEQVVDETGRGLRELVSQRLYLVAVLAGAVGYGVMSFIMTATPIQLHELHGYDLDQTALVIQSHIAAMYAPSLFTGFLMDRLGEVRVILMGLVAMFAAVALNVAGVDLAHYGAGLVLLGVGWNFLFIGGTVLLTRTYQPSERFRAQAANDFGVFGVTAAASLSAGAVLLPIGWDALNLVVVPFLLTVLAGVIAIRRGAYRKAVGEDAVVVST
jgi:MFS family permease